MSTYGDVAQWARLALTRAVPSALAQQLPAEGVYYSHGPTLAEARNAGARRATGDWLCFLDADDELDRGYLAAMAETIAQLPAGQPHLLQPATIGVVDGREDPRPHLIPVKSLLDGNYLVIGTVAPRQLVLDLGGFHEWPYAEDWDLWLRCWLHGGAQSVPVPDAVYRVHVRAGSRNNGDRAGQVRAYNQIRSRHLAAGRRRQP